MSDNALSDRSEARVVVRAAVGWAAAARVAEVTVVAAARLRWRRWRRRRWRQQ